MERKFQTPTKLKNLNRAGSGLMAFLGLGNWLCNYDGPDFGDRTAQQAWKPDEGCLMEGNRETPKPGNPQKTKASSNLNLNLKTLSLSLSLSVAKSASAVKTAYQQPAKSQWKPTKPVTPQPETVNPRTPKPKPQNPQP